MGWSSTTRIFGAAMYQGKKAGTGARRKHASSRPDRKRKALKVFLINIATVMGPTPPGTG